MFFRCQFILYFLMFANFAKAQSFKYTQYTTYNGLPIDNVYAAAQDDNGFLWLGTDFGISKFDGYQFKNFNRGNGIETKAITDIVYAGGDSCVFLSYPNTLQSINGKGKVNTLIKNTGIALEQLVKHGNKYYFYQRNMFLYGIYENGKNNLYDIRNTLHDKNIILRSITSLQNSGLIYSTNKGIFWDNYKTIKQLLPNEDVYFVLYKKDKTLLAATTTHVKNSNLSFEFKSQGSSFPNREIIFNMVEDSSENVWMRGIGKGIYHFANNKLEEKSAMLNMQNKGVHKFFIDNQKNTWFCTSGAGLLVRGKNIFTNFETQDGLANNKVLQLIKTKNNIVIGTENGVSVKNTNTIKQLNLPKVKEGLQYVHKLFKDESSDFGICIDNTFSFDNISLNDAKINKVLIDGFKITPLNGIMGWQQKANTYCTNFQGELKVVVNNKLINKYNLRQFGIRKIYDITEYENKIFVASTDGLLTIESNKIQFNPFINNQKLGEVFQFLIDKNNKLWIATENGLITFRNNKYTLLPKANTAGGNYCKSITLDNENKIWCATWDGVFVTDGVTKKSFSSSNGLISKTCHAILYDSATNELYIGSDNGLSVINKNLLFTSEINQKLFVSCKSEENRIEENSKLNSNQNSLSFYCNVPYFEAGKNITYEYKFCNSNWTTSTTPNINLTDMSGGKHIVLFRAKINGDIICEKSFTFSIKHKFYKTWLFWILAAIGLQYLIFKLINNYNKKEREKKNIIQKQDIELTTLKQQAFTSLMNPHFIFNALNSIQHYINKQDRQMANKYLSDFAMLVRKSFDAAQKPFVPLEDEIETIRLYLQLEQMRFANKFDYSINLSEAVEEDDWMIPSMVLQPFLENAIIHGIAPLTKKGKLSIDISAKENILYITIADNGIGIEKSQELKVNTIHKSKGMYLIKERLQLLSRYSKNPIALNISPNLTGGTIITLIVPQAVIKEFKNIS